MKGHGEKLGRKREQAIAALLSCASIKAAAESISINESTLRGWLVEPSFLASYRAARRAVVESAVSRLQQLTSEAVEALQRNLNTERPGDQIRAAVAILDKAIAAVELVDMEERIAALEAKSKP